MRRFSLSHPLPHAVALLLFLLLALAADLTAGSGRRSGRTRLTTGVSLHYVERGDPRGRTVIFLHGLSDSWYSFDRVTALMPSSLRTIAIDQRGHGDSERPATGYGMRDLAKDVVAFMDAHRISRATIVGHSMGSLVAQQVAVIAPARVEKLVLIGSATHGDKVLGIDELEGAVRGLTDPVSLDFTTEFQRSTVFTPIDSGFLARVSEDSRKLPAGAWRALVAGMRATPVATELRAARTPTRLIWGDQDSYFPRSEQDALLAMIPGSTLSVYSQSGHAVHWERATEVAREITGFVKGKLNP